MRGQSIRAVRFAGGVVIGGLLAGTFFFAGVPASAQDSTPATSPTPGITGDATPNLDCVTSGPLGADGTAVAPAATFTINAEKSEARYVAQEKLQGIGDNTAIGKTNAIIGQIYFDNSGAVLACSGLAVDLRTLKSDESRRDNFLYHNTLEAERYPVATFFLTSVEGLTTPLTDGQTADVVLHGDLTIKDTTKSVAWIGTITRTSDAYSVSAKTVFDMKAFNITPPKVGPVISLDSELQLEIDFEAIPAAR